MSFCDNNSLFSDFHDSEAGVISNETVDYIDWPSENAGNPLQKTLVTGLITSPPPDIRIIFAPLDLDLEALAGENDRAYALQWQRINHTLLERYDVPPDFLEERLHSACLGSGSRTYKDGSNACWLHYLCKSVDIEDGNNGDKDFPQITDHHPDKEVELHKLSQTNWTWLRAGFFLKWGPPKKRTSNGTLINPVTLLCFGASQAMKNRFGRIPNGPTLKMDIDPFQLFVIVLDELFQEMDKQVWNLSDVFRGIEHKAFIEADQTSYSTSRSKRDFAGLHNVAKYCIYLKEAFKAIDLAIEDLITEHNRLFNSDEAVKTKAHLNHKQRLFKSVSLRLDSLDKRTQNILNLSFHLVAQQDNSVMLKDSKTMKAIAIVTMFFLPATSVAAICGSQFFGLDTSQSPPEIRVAGRIWIFCIVAVVMTVVVLGSWWMLNESTFALQNEKKKRWNNWLFKRQKQRKQIVC